MGPPRPARETSLEERDTERGRGGKREEERDRERGREVGRGGEGERGAGRKEGGEHGEDETEDRKH